MTRCSSCNNKDFQGRYALMVDDWMRPGQLCAECFDEWLGVDHSRRKAKFESMKKEQGT